MIKDFFDKPFTLDRLSKIFFSVLFAALGLLLFQKLSGILIPFILAWIIAHLLMPLVYFFERKLKIRKRPLSVLLVLTIVIGSISGILVAIWPSLTAEANKAWELIQTYASFEALKSILPPSIIEQLEQYPDVASVMNEFNMENLIKTLQQFLTKSVSILASTFSIIMSTTVVFLFFLYLIFIMMDYEKLNEGFMKLIPEHLKPFVREAGKSIEYYLTNYFKGQSLIALCVGVLLAIGYSIQGLPLGILLGIFIGVLNLVPYLQILGLLPIVFLSMLHSAETGQNLGIVLAIALGILLLVQIIQDTFLTPRIMGKTMGMRPAVILVSLSIFGYLFGLLGMVIALPSTMILYTFHMKYIVGKPVEDDEVIEKDKESIWSKVWKKARRKE
ncbi:MAG: AI-2E family transporter [Porphyromonas sp.]|nr:AI-2E family transporter [Porphyromonas sp.]